MQKNDTALAMTTEQGEADVVRHIWLGWDYHVRPLSLYFNVDQMLYVVCIKTFTFSMIPQETSVETMTEKAGLLSVLVDDEELATVSNAS